MAPPKSCTGEETTCVFLCTITSRVHPLRFPHNLGHRFLSTAIALQNPIYIGTRYFVGCDRLFVVYRFLLCDTYILVYRPSFVRLCPNLRLTLVLTISTVLQDCEEATVGVVRWWSIFSYPLETTGHKFNAARQNNDSHFFALNSPCFFLPGCSKHLCRTLLISWLWTEHLSSWVYF
jgi:hypothetical protein